MPLTELPFGFPGRVFRSPMPFGPYDLHGEVYDRFCEAQTAVIVLLASDEECLHRAGCNLRAWYLKEGFQVLYLPIPDFGWCPSTPVMGKLAAMNVIYRIFSPMLFYYGIYLSKMPRSD